MDGLGRGVLVGRRAIYEPQRTEFHGHLGADLGAFVLRQGTVDVAGGLGAGFCIRTRRGDRGAESGEAAGGEDGLGGVPVGPASWGAGLGVGAEDVAEVVSGDLELLTVGGDDRDVGLPLALVLGVGGWLAERLHPCRTVADGDVG